MFAPTLSAHAATTVGKAAPSFTATDSKGKTHSLSDYAGKIVVLEWTNDQCPFVRKHYDSKNMQQLQAEAAKQGVIWLTINSGAKDKQGHVTPEQAETIITREGMNPTAYLLDENGTLGHAYGASTTPHMFVIDKDGTLVYQGAIDDNSSANTATIVGAKNYVRAALADLAAGKPVETASSQPYGCGVKY
jgi:peroxiredoxin